MKNFKQFISEGSKLKGKIWYFDMDSKKPEVEDSLTGITNPDDIINVFSISGLNLKIDPHTFDKFVIKNGKSILGKDDVFIYYDNKYVFFAKNKKELMDHAQKELDIK